MNFGKLPSIPSVPTPPPNPVAPPTHASTDVGRGPLQGNVGIGLPQHLDPNKPAVGVDATIHNPTGVGGDIHIKKDVPIPTHVPDINLPSMGSMGSSAPDPLAKSGGGFGLPKIPSFGMPSMPDLSLPSMPSMPDISMPSLPDMPSIGMPDMPSFGMPDLPSFGMPDLPSFGMPDISLPGMPGFRFPDLPKFELPDIDLSEWDLSMPDLIPDWGGDSEEERQEPHKRAKHQDKLTVEISLKNEDGIPIPGIWFEIHGKNGFKHKNQLDQDGKKLIDIPRGDYSVTYLDQDQIYFRGIAVAIFAHKDDFECAEFETILHIPVETISVLSKTYNALYSDGLAGSFASVLRKWAIEKRFEDQIESIIRTANIG